MNGHSDSSDAMSALLSFKARNVRSYREEVHLSLLATRLSDTDVVRHVDAAGASAPVSVLPVAGIFGANASGKSTVLRAMADMRAIVLGSFRHGDHQTRMRRHPFLLQDESACPSHFEVDLILSGVAGSMALKSMTTTFSANTPTTIQKVAKRWSFAASVIVRSRISVSCSVLQGLSLHVWSEGTPSCSRWPAAAADAKPEDRPRIVAMLGPLFAWFRTSLLLMDSGNGTQRIARTADLTRSSQTREQVLALIRAADLGITDLERFHRDFDPELAERVQRALRILNGI